LCIYDQPEEKGGGRKKFSYPCKSSSNPGKDNAGTTFSYKWEEGQGGLPRKGKRGHAFAQCRKKEGEGRKTKKGEGLRSVSRCYQREKREEGRGKRENRGRKIGSHDISDAGAVTEEEEGKRKKVER